MIFMFNFKLFRQKILLFYWMLFSFLFQKKNKKNKAFLFNIKKVYEIIHRLCTHFLGLNFYASVNSFLQTVYIIIIAMGNNKPINPMPL